MYLYTYLLIKKTSWNKPLMHNRDLFIRYVSIIFLFHNGAFWYDKGQYNVLDDTQEIKISQYNAFSLLKSSIRVHIACCTYSCVNICNKY